MPNIFGDFTAVGGYRGLQDSYGDDASMNGDDMVDTQFFAYGPFGGYPGGFYHGLSWA